MYKFDGLLKTVLILFLATTLIHSQDYPTLLGKGKPVINAADSEVLYEQLGNFGPNSLTSQNFETAYDIYDSQGADDFVIPSGDGTWTVESVEVLGVYFDGTGPANSVNVWFYSDNSGLPDTVVAYRLSIVPTDGLASGSFVITFASPITLLENTYWISVQCNMDSAVGGQWGWTEQQQSGAESAWQNPDGGWGTSCTTWGHRITDCTIGTAPYYDLSFRLNGYKGGPCPVEAASNPIPVDDSSNVPITDVSLSWENGAGTQSVEVWFGSNDRILKLYDGSAITSWPLGNLSYGNHYQWYIVCKDDTCGIQGPVWTFITMLDTSLVIDTIYVFPQNLNNWTGTCNSANKTQISLVNGINTEIGWMTFDITAIPNNVTINSVTFNGYLYDNSWPYWSVTPMGSVNPVTDGASTIYNYVSTHYGQGVAYSYNIESATLSNDWVTRELGTTALTDLQNSLIKNWFAIGVVDFDFSTNYYVKFHGWAEENKPYLRVIYSYVGATTFQLSVDIEDDWNMVSIPGLNSPNQKVNTWWPFRDSLANVFRFIGGLGYHAVYSVTVGEGYWMKHSGDRTYNTGDEWPAEGIRIVAHDPINLALGWNMFGGYEEVVLASGLTTIPSGLLNGPVYGYSGGYYIPTFLQPGHGYWVKLSNAGQIIIPDASEKIDGEKVDWFKDDWGRITITDASGRSYTLYAVKGEIDLNLYELPPIPPAGMFDIRFNSGRIAEDISSSVKMIEMNGVTYPLMVRVEGIDIRLEDETGKIINVKMKSGEDVLISDATIKRLMVKGDLIPASYLLEQNYPNPFNPTTMIEFSLPENVNNVRLSIYNTLGEKVAELVNTSLNAGRYQYQWDARDVATGIYLYELRTDKFVSAKKMILMK